MDFAISSSFDSPSADYPDESLAADLGKNSSFSCTGGEQDAMAEYLAAFHSSAGEGYNIAETDRNGDGCIMY